MIVRLRSFARFVVTLLALLGLAQPLALQARPARPAIVQPALWKVTGKDATIWLFGTIHALPKGLAWYRGPVATAFEGSDTLVTEIIEKSPEEMRPIVVAKAMLPAGQSLRDMLTPADRAAFEKAVTGSAMPVAAFDRYQPWYAAVALATLPLLSSGYDPANGVDAQLSDRAAAAKRQHEALETPEFQLGLFGSLPIATQKKYLREVVDNLPKLKGELNGIIAAWKAGNAARLAKLMNEDEDDPVLEEKLLLGRNREWAKWIAARLDKPGKVFIAVGAGHLAGAGSVQDQLRKAGFTVTRVQ